MLDLKPALDEGKLDARFLRDLEAYANRSMENALADLFPHSMIPVLLRRAGIDPALRANSLTRQQRRALLLQPLQPGIRFGGGLRQPPRPLPGGAQGKAFLRLPFHVPEWDLMHGAQVQHPLGGGALAPQQHAAPQIIP